MSPKEEMEFNSLFKSLRPNYQLEYLITKRKKKRNVIFVMHRVKIYLGSSLFSFYQGMVRIQK